MELPNESKLLRIYIGESDKIEHRPLFEAIVFAAKKYEMAGATVMRGIMSYGASSRVHSAKLIDISTDLPIVVEIVDEEQKINSFVPIVDDLLKNAGCGGLVTIERAIVLNYRPRKG
jgi:PII-like signaling protein